MNLSSENKVVFSINFKIHQTDLRPSDVLCELCDNKKAIRALCGDLVPLA
jgi:hypothetical protein